MSLEKNSANKDILDHLLNNNDLTEHFLIGHDNPAREKSNQEYFYNGLYCLYKNKLVDAKQHLLQSLNTTDKVETLFWKSLSFLGLVEVLLYRSNGGLFRCYEAKKECPDNPEIYLNIAYSEYKLGNRKRCVSTLQQCLKLEPDNKQAHSFFECIGKKTRRYLIKNIFGNFFRGNKNDCSMTSFNNQIQNYISITLDSHVKHTAHQSQYL